MRERVYPQCLLWRSGILLCVRHGAVAWHASHAFVTYILDTHHRVLEVDPCWQCPLQWSKADAGKHHKKGTNVISRSMQAKASCLGEGKRRRHWHEPLAG